MPNNADFETKFLVLTTYPREDASRRLRIDPLVERLRASGYRVFVHCLLPSWAYKRKNQGLVWRTFIAFRLALALAARAFRIFLINQKQVVIIHREAFPFFTPLFEHICARRSRFTVIDVDDAIHHAPTHVPDWRRLLRRPANFTKALSRAELVFAGSPSMVNIAKRSGAREVALTPTGPPQYAFDAYDEERERGGLLWTGTFSTLLSLQQILPEVLLACADADQKLHVLGGENVRGLPGHPHMHARVWSTSRERTALATCAIGLMPLPDSPWEHGKSAYKALLYMAAGIVPVISPVGMNVWLSDQCSGVVLCGSDRWGELLTSLLRDPNQVVARSQACREWAVQQVISDRIVDFETAAIERHLAISDGRSLHP